MLPTQTLYGKVLLCFGLTVKYAPKDPQLQFVKVQKKWKLKFYCSSFDDKNKSVSILSLLLGSVNCFEAQIVALVLLFQVNDPSPSYVPSFGEKD